MALARRPQGLKFSNALIQLHSSSRALVFGVVVMLICYVCALLVANWRHVVVLGVSFLVQQIKSQPASLMMVEFKIRRTRRADCASQRNTIQHTKQSEEAPTNSPGQRRAVMARLAKSGPTYLQCGPVVVVAASCLWSWLSRQRCIGLIRGASRGCGTGRRARQGGRR